MKTIAVWRILGNHIPKRHGRDSEITALKFMLTHEPTLRSADKFFLLNRVYDAELRGSYLQVLDYYGFSEDKGNVVELPFDSNAYTKSRNPLKYVTNINAARNCCIKHSRQNDYQVCFPLDARSFFAPGDWTSLEQRIQSKNARHYLLLQTRVPTLMDATKQLAPADFQEWSERGRQQTEQAVGFSEDAELVFDEKRVFGDCDKAEVLASLGVPGPWITWVRNSRNLARYANDVEYGKAEKVGHVRILPSGNPAADGDAQKRGAARAEGLRSMLDEVNLHVNGLLARKQIADAL